MKRGSDTLIPAVERLLGWRDFAVPLPEVLNAVPTSTSCDLPPGSVVVIRGDLDVPLSDGTVRDTARIEACLPTIEEARDRQWRIVLTGHLGRKGTETLAAVAQEFADRLRVPVPLLHDWFDGDNLTASALRQIAEMSPGDIVMLENLRQYPAETALWGRLPEEAEGATAEVFSFANALGTVGELHINECFAASNLDTSSTVASLCAPRTALGKYTATELTEHIIGALRANFVVFSGAKANKLDDLQELVNGSNVRAVMAAGALAIALAMARSPEATYGLASTEPDYIGFIDEARSQQAREIVAACDRNGIKLLLPSDFVLDDGTISDTVPDGRAQMDVGPQTRHAFHQAVLDFAHESAAKGSEAVIFYNGVFGKFEDEAFSHGTQAFIGTLKAASTAGAKIYVGGGEGRSALIRFGRLDDVTHAFTAGGTVLKLLAGNTLPYLVAMYLANNNEVEMT